MSFFNEDLYRGPLSTEKLGRRLTTLAETGSTNTYLGDTLKREEGTGLLVVAEHQSAGRGRFGRKWISPPGENLTFSFAWEIPQNLEQPGVVTLAVGLALAVTAKSFGVNASLKYPNDLLAHGKKLAGILTELKNESEKRWAVIGVGLNVNTRPDRFPDELNNLATSFYIEKGEEVKREMALALFMNNAEKRLDTLRRSGISALADEYRRHCSISGRTVTVMVDGSQVAGVADGIDDTGALMVTKEDGDMVAVIAGEVTFNR